MLVIKRDQRKESVKFDKITARIEKLSYGLNTKYVKTIEIAKKVIDGIYDGVSTQELDELAAETAATLNNESIFQLLLPNIQTMRFWQQEYPYLIFTKQQANLFQIL